VKITSKGKGTNKGWVKKNCWLVMCACSIVLQFSGIFGYMSFANGSRDSVYAERGWN